MRVTLCLCRKFHFLRRAVWNHGAFDDITLIELLAHLTAQVPGLPEEEAQKQQRDGKGHCKEEDRDHERADE